MSFSIELAKNITPMFKEFDFYNTLYSFSSNANVLLFAGTEVHQFTDYVDFTTSSNLITSDFLEDLSGLIRLPGSDANF
jgi:hypothetical protein